MPANILTASTTLIELLQQGGVVTLSGGAYYLKSDGVEIEVGSVGPIANKPGHRAYSHAPCDNAGLRMALDALTELRDKEFSDLTPVSSPSLFLK